MVVTALQRELGLPLRCWPHTLLFGKLKTSPGYHHRRFATESTITGSKTTSRKQITVVNDDGRVSWAQLSLKEKAARTTQQTFNFGVIIAGALMTGGVAYILYTEVFSTDSKTTHFNRAVDRIKGDKRAIELLGPANKIRAYGEPVMSKWTRNRPIASKKYKDRSGVEHLTIHFNIEGLLNSGSVYIHMTKTPDQPEHVYKYLALDVKGHPRLYLENSDAAKKKKSSPLKMLGITWR